MNKIDKSLTEGILFTDLYQLTMAQLYFRAGLHERPAQFDHYFRSCPNYGEHQAGYAVNAGLEWLVSWMGQAAFREPEIDHLRHHKGRNNTRTFSDDFLEWLTKNGHFQQLSLNAIPEGRVIHPNTVITQVQGPLAMSQILESALLNYLNYTILIATKAARIFEAGQRQPLLEFGMRRAHGQAANAGVRAALIGGASFSSNAGVSYALGYPPKGTHAHSMVQAFMALGGSELDAFQAYADSYPDDCLLLVDTINTLQSGVPNAIKVFERLKRKGHRPVGIRLDSGDLAWLSIQAAKMLNDAGFEATNIILSNQIDEMVLWQVISQIKEEAAGYGVDPERLIKRLIYGVGTGLITSKGHGALDGVYKLVAVNNGTAWVPAIKISENREKILNPGKKRILRLYDRKNKAVADLVSVWEEEFQAGSAITLHHPTDGSKYRVLAHDCIHEIEPLLTEIIKHGEIIYDFPSIERIRTTRQKDLDCLDQGVKRLINPHVYHVSLSPRLWTLKEKLIRKTAM